MTIRLILPLALVSYWLVSFVSHLGISWTSAVSETAEHTPIHILPPATEVMSPISTPALRPTNISPLATPTPSFTVVPSHTPSPTLTPTVGPTVTLPPVLLSTSDPELQAKLLLEAYPQEFCPEYTTVIDCIAPLQIKILDFLHSNPDSPHRQALLDRIIVDPQLFPWEALPWLKDDWLEETIKKPFNNNNGLPPGFKERWQAWGQFFTTDLDNNGEPDYLLALPLTDHCPQDGELYWVHRVGNSHQIIQLPTTFDYSEESIYPTILAIKDLNGDGQAEVAYTVYTCGASTRSLKLRVLTWQENRFKDLLVGNWTPSNGEWKIEDEDGDSIYELRGTDHGSGSAGFGPFLPYELSFDLSHGEYAPKEQTALAKPDAWPKNEDGELLYWQWARQLFQTGSFAESLEIFRSMAEDQVSSADGWIDFRPYALFYQGAAQLLLENTTEAHRVWSQLAAEFPQHPVGQAAGEFTNIVQTKEDMWKACGWLHHNSSDWFDPRWAASENAINYAKWQRDTGGNRDYQKWLADQGKIDYLRERQLLEDVFIPDYYSTHLHWHGLCQPVFLMGLRQWPLEIPLVKQFTTLGVEWEEISARYDLNQDGRVDPIGLLHMNDKRFLWAFLSQEKLYEPLSVTQSYPVDAVYVWQGVQYIQGWEIWTESAVNIIDLDNNGMPEAFLPYPGGASLWEWIGHRFQFHNVYYPNRYYEQDGFVETEITFVPLSGGTTGFKSRLFFHDSPEQTLDEYTYYLSEGSLEQVGSESFSSPYEIELLGQAAEALFRENEPQTALKLLDDYNTANLPDYYPSRQWYEAAGLYLKALALEYSGNEAEAQPIFSTLTQDFAGTGWSLLAREKLPNWSN